MNERRLLLLVIVVLLFTLAACGEPTPESPVETVQEAADDVADANNRVMLTDSAWALEMIGSPGDELPLIEGVTPTLNFFVGRYNGFTGCNFFLAAYDVDGKSIGLYGPTQTAIQCDEPEGIMEQEAIFISVLQSSLAYAADEEKLTLFATDDQALATFARIEDTSLEGTTWMLKAFVEDEAPVPVFGGSTVTALLDGDQLSGNAGCNDYTATLVVEDATIAVGEVTSTDSTCDGPEDVMNQEAAYLSMLEDVTAYDVGGSSLLFIDQEGVPVMLFTADE